MYPVYDISGFSSQRPESLGTKEKRWVIPPRDHQLLRPRPHLFKIGRLNTGENWSEKACAEICKYIGLPCAEYDFAFIGEERGVITETFIPDGAFMFTASAMLARIVTGYDANKRFTQVQYTINRAINVLKPERIKPPIGSGEEIIRLTPYEIFIGYLVFDALVGNTDRHHENWGIVAVNSGSSPEFYLAPTFDHASSLGRNELPEKRQLRLETTDQRATVEAYAAKARTALYSAGATKPLTTREMIAELVRSHPDITRYWAHIMVQVPLDVFTGIFDRMSPDWVDTSAREFALRMLQANQNMLSETALG